MPPKKRSGKTKKGRKNKSKSKIVSSDDVITSDNNVLYLEDIIEKIFLYLDYESLCAVQHVCRCWQKKACERISKNYPPFFIKLPVLYCTERSHLLHHQVECIENNPTIKNLITTVPEKVVIIFTDGQFPEGLARIPICLSANLDNVIDDYLNFLPHHSFAVYEFIFVDNVEIKGTKNLMTAVVFPITPSIEVRSCIVTSERMDKLFDYSDVLLELFEFDDPMDKESCFIILGINHKDCKPRRNSKFIRGFLNYLREESYSHKMTIWGGAHVEVAHSNIEPDSVKIQWHILHIIGINSYSIALSLDLNEETFKKKLQDLKNKMSLKKTAFALAITHTKSSKSEEKGQIMKKVLWFKEVFNITLTTTLSYIEDYSCDPIIFCNPSDNADLKIENKNLNTVAYLIINN